MIPLGNPKTTIKNRFQQKLREFESSQNWGLSYELKKSSGLSTFQQTSWLVQRILSFTHTIHGTKKYICLHERLIFFMVNVVKYTIHVMDGMGLVYKPPWFSSKVRVWSLSKRNFTIFKIFGNESQVFSLWKNTVWTPRSWPEHHLFLWVKIFQQILGPTWMSQEISKWLVNGLWPTSKGDILGLKPTDPNLLQTCKNMQAFGF